MVYPDLSPDNRLEKPAKYKIAPVTDRLLAFLLDLLLFSPLFSLVFSSLIKKMQLRYYTSPGSTEFLVFALLTVGGISLLAILLNTICLWKWGTTPGKYFFKLKVLSTTDSQGKLLFSQCLLRSTLWLWQLYFLGLPLIEVFSQRHRRAIHDRAADTMVVTLKTIPERGPHPLESHFVRNFILILVFAAMLWGTFLATNLYLMASRGDFKKTEMEEGQSLCSAVSVHNNGQFQRLDFALALFLAGEVDEDCLLSEADFALWTQDRPQQAWAYLAKSIYFEFDSDRSNEYLARVCEMEKGSEACRLAHALQSQDHRTLVKSPKSLSAQVLQIRELAGLGEFAKGLNVVSDLAQKSEGFERFSQKQTVKFLWTLNRREQAVGAYLNTWPHMDRQDQTDIAAWMCLEEVEDRCEIKGYHACENLKASLQTSELSNISTEAVIGLVKEGECKKTHDLPLLTFNAVLDENPGLRDFVLAISSDSDWSEERRLDVLRHLSFSKQLPGGKVIQRRALLALMQRSQGLEDFTLAEKWLEENERHDWQWKKVAKALWQNAEKQGFQKLADQTLKEWPNLQDSAVPSVKMNERLPASESGP